MVLYVRNYWSGFLDETQLNCFQMLFKKYVNVFRGKLPTRMQNANTICQNIYLNLVKNFPEKFLIFQIVLNIFVQNFR